MTRKGVTTKTKKLAVEIHSKVHNNPHFRVKDLSQHFDLHPQTLKNHYNAVFGRLLTNEIIESRLKFIETNPNLTPKEVATKLGLTMTPTQKLIRLAKEQKRIAQVRRFPKKGVKKLAANETQLSILRICGWVGEDHNFTYDQLVNVTNFSKVVVKKSVRDLTNLGLIELKFKKGKVVHYGPTPKLRLTLGAVELERVEIDRRLLNSGVRNRGAVLRRKERELQRVGSFYLFARPASLISEFGAIQRVIRQRKAEISRLRMGK